MIDTSLLRSLFEDEALVKKYLAVFRQDVPLSMSDMKSSILNQDWEHTSIIAHSLKSQLQYLNETQASETALSIEKMCDTGLEPDLEILTSEIKTLENSLQNIFKNLDEVL